MTAENFCYWLQGYIELTEAAWRVPLPQGENVKHLEISKEQLTEIKKHLGYVFAQQNKEAYKAPASIPDLMEMYRRPITDIPPMVTC